MQQINDCGERAASRAPDMRYRDEEIRRERIQRGVMVHGGDDSKDEV
ncbi:hypothetical protein PHO31112_01385 [Pandoraea horticolens]|uniref:Uncharacterized protein n=1 Tax=Pandoraea horticolens TaxID=2508298 RepID=A0A5E4TDT2_9BURK|nr:hypothetical protein [Pandoraea horticolens]VVD86376.1 hypothetical protein PHO31112_01385 [Pandoraea horticolens]